MGEESKSRSYLVVIYWLYDHVFSKKPVVWECGISALLAVCVFLGVHFAFVYLRVSAEERHARKELPALGVAPVVTNSAEPSGTCSVGVAGNGNVVSNSDCHDNKSQGVGKEK